MPASSTVSESEAADAVEVALADGRVSMGQEFDTVSVERVEPDAGQYVRVVLRGHVEQEPPDACAIGGHSGTVTGLVFLISDPPKTVEALSPEWDSSVSCLGRTDAL
jgi:hypothetical protein